MLTIATRLIRVTRELPHRDQDRAMAAIAVAVTGRRGGTRLGVGPGFVSDGWERGDPEPLMARMRRLHLLPHLVIWAQGCRPAPGRAGASGVGGERSRRCVTSSRC
ncbi:hypothetical protein [Streptomyces sp. NPDC006335]|uniref:hypothetical protein n=1 Tax=Streptomyces sp. NPDC006335 TaxID=3156895 RepID=UPI0033BA1F01